jgi:hypothetical protein
MRNSRLAGSAPSSSLRARSPLLGVGAGNARPEEIQRPMPLGETIQDPNYITHRAITIHARPEEVWPWLAQMRDLPRGGFYSYAWIERLMGMKVENAARILLECQSLENGQALDRAGTMLVKACGPNRCLVLGPPGGTRDGALYPEDDSSTRLVSRVRARLDYAQKGFSGACCSNPASS